MGPLQSGLNALAVLAQTGVWIELALLAACLGGAWLAVRKGRRVDVMGRTSVVFGARGFDGVLFPLVALLLALATRWAVEGRLNVSLLRLALPILASLALIRLVVQVLHRTFPQSPLVRSLERSVSWLVWGVLALWISELWPPILAELDGIHWRVGGENLSLRRMLEGALSAVVVLVLALWLSSAIEARLLAATGTVDLSARKMATTVLRALLLLIGLLLALSAAGIPLTALSVLGGALGVGIGLGLQKLAANYVSGFVLLAERSVRIGDVVKVDGFEGRISDIKTRYTVIRSNTGRESIVPNEMLVTQRVESSSLADPQVAVISLVQVAYGTDLAALMPALVQTMASVPRVLTEPAPAVQLSQFAPDGLELTLVFWIGDPEHGQGNVRSDVNLAVLAALNERGVVIAYPQRVVRSV